MLASCPLSFSSIRLQGLIAPLVQPSGEAPLDEQLAGLEEQCKEEKVWGQALLHVSEGLSAGRRWLWDEASRKISVLLASPAAFAGEHFLQVLHKRTANIYPAYLLEGAQQCPFSAACRPALQFQKPCVQRGGTRTCRLPPNNPASNSHCCPSQIGVHVWACHDLLYPLDLMSSLSALQARFESGIQRGDHAAERTASTDICSVSAKTVSMPF